MDQPSSINNYILFSNFNRILYSCQRSKSCSAFQQISCMELSECSRYVAIGTMSGTVDVHDARAGRHFAQLYHFPGAHSSFVTALTFLPKRCHDASDLGGRIGNNAATPRPFLPGLCGARAAVVSISVDQTIQLHQVFSFSQ